jgi:hypothetical protein
MPFITYRMDKYHEDIQRAANGVFQDWNKRHSNLEQSLKTGRFVRQYARTRAQSILENANLQHGMYIHHGMSLSGCIESHIERWIEVRLLSSKITQTFISEMPRRCLSMAEIVVIMLLLKTRYYIGKLTQELCDTARGLLVPHYNPEIKWSAVFEAVVTNVQSRQKVTCPELSRVFQIVIGAVFTALTRNPMILDKNVDMLKTLYADTHTWEDIELSQDDKQNICYGGVNPKLLAHRSGRILRTLECYRNFENGEYSDLSALLVTVQLTTRCSIIFNDHSDQQFITQKEREGKFSNVKLIQITDVSNSDPLYELFQYPKSFEGGRTPLMQCDVEIDGKLYSPTLELAIAYALFGEHSHDVINDALKGFMVDRKIEYFMKKSTDTVTYLDTTFPKKWMKYKFFKDLME